MNVFQQLRKKAENLQPNRVEDELLEYLQSIQKVLTELNVQQIEQGKGSDNKPLVNSNKKYNSVYSRTTQLLSERQTPKPLAPKIAGQPYNFLNRGEFLPNFDLFRKGKELQLFSTGTGSGDKKDFFDGYKNLYGLNEDSLRKLIKEYVLPYFQKYYLDNMTID